MRLALLFVVLACGTPGAGARGAPPGTSEAAVAPILPLSAYTSETLHGATIRWHPDFVAAPDLATQVRAALAADLDTYARTSPAASAARLAEVRIAVAVTTPDVAELPSHGRGVGYHRSAGWLTAHGLDAEREAVIEIYNAADYLAKHEAGAGLSGVIDGVLALRAGPDDRIRPLREYTPERLAPLTVLWHPTLLSEHTELATRVRAALKADIGAIRRAVPGAALSRLEGVRIVVNERSFDEHGLRRGGAATHRSAAWLVDHGFDAEREGAVEIYDAQDYLDVRAGDQPMVLLHELTHVLEQADEASFGAVQAAYDAAVASGRYEAVAHVGGGAPRRAYALNNPAEYGAELAEALFGRNDFAPFDRPELVAFDPVGCAAVARLWSAGCPTEGGG